MDFKEKLKAVDKRPAQEFKDNYKETMKFMHELVKLIEKYHKNKEIIIVVCKELERHPSFKEAVKNIYRELGIPEEDLERLVRC